MAYYITGTATFSSTANRDAALTRLNNALGSLSFTAIGLGGLTAGIATPTSTTITVSMIEGNTPASVLAKAIYDSWTASNRHNQGYLSVSKV